jgi:hypothetical protein
LRALATAQLAIIIYMDCRFPFPDMPAVTTIYLHDAGKGI